MDISESKTVTMLFDENRRLRQALQSSMSGVLVTNSEGIVRFVNNKWLELHNLTINQVMNKSVYELHPERKAMIKRQMKEATPEGIPLEPTEHSFDHHKSIFLGGFLKLLVGKKKNTSGYLWSIHDITDQMKTEESLRKQNRTLSKLNELMVGRELKMVKLKKEIKTLRQQLAEQKASARSTKGKVSNKVK